MKRFSAGLVLMLLCTFSIFAQNKVITVSGRVVESDTKEPAAQATVQLIFQRLQLLVKFCVRQEFGLRVKERKLISVW